MTVNRNHRSGASIPAFAAFVPFGTLLIYRSYHFMPLKWVCLAVLLKAISALSVYINLTDNDLLWSSFGILSFIIVSTPVYVSVVKVHRVMDVQKNCGKITFTKLFKMCLDAFFSDHRIALTATISLVMQVLVGGSILYNVFGADWVMHALAGFGISVAAAKAYRTGIDYYGYSSLVSYLHLDRFRILRTEKGISWLAFTFFSLMLFASSWEIFERAVYFESPVNAFRIGLEQFWNTFGDIVSAIIGGIAAWYLAKCKLKWL
jgi:hypothetical protein